MNSINLFLPLALWVLGAISIYAQESVVRAPTFDSGRVGFHTSVNGVHSDYRLRSIAILPGGKIDIRASRPFALSIKAGEGALEKKNRNYWVWSLPERPLVYTAELTAEGDAAPVKIQAFVQVPYSAMQKGKIHGYSVGTYALGSAAYPRPFGFIEVTSVNENTYVSPHFQLKQFLCKQGGSFPKYVVLYETLLIKLERILEKLNQVGIVADDLYVMSGYRTPYYNKSLGNVNNSRHILGDAADIFVDTSPKDGRMDDLNGDGRIDVKDSAYLKEIVESLERDPQARELAGVDYKIGGIGVYSSNSSHGPFVHVDARGTPARWGVEVGANPSPRKNRTGRDTEVE